MSFAQVAHSFDPAEQRRSGDMSAIIRSLHDRLAHVPGPLERFTT